MTKHLVLGGGGFIGSSLCKRLLSNGHEVTAVDIAYPAFRKPQYREDYVLDTHPSMTKFQVDLRSPGRCRSLFSGQSGKYDVVWQLAADMGGVEYFHSEHDWAAALNNQIINNNLMWAISQSRQNPRVVFTSTACALATENQSPGNLYFLEEDDITWGTPDQLYGQEKRNSALLWNSSPMDTRVAFLHTVYGPYQEHSGIRMKFPSAVAQKARKARETGTIELFGDGTQIRTYLYIDDALDRLLALGSSDRDPGFVNIGGNIPLTVDEVAHTVLQAAGVPSAALLHQPDKPTGVLARAADMTKFDTAFPEFRGKARVDELEGFTRFIAWLDEVDPL